MHAIDRVQDDERYIESFSCEDERRGNSETIMKVILDEVQDIYTPS
jgi:hypothetical protein